jgi:hypothetical protein
MVANMAELRYALNLLNALGDNDYRVRAVNCAPQDPVNYPPDPVAVRCCRCEDGSCLILIGDEFYCEYCLREDR